MQVGPIFQQNYPFSQVSTRRIQSWRIIFVCDFVSSWNIHVWTVGKILDFIREDSESDVFRVRNKRHFKRKHMAHPLFVGAMFKFNNIEIRAPSLESRSVKDWKIARAFNSILHLQNPDKFEEGVRIKRLFPEFVCSRVWHHFCYKLQKSQIPEFDITFAANSKRDLCPFKNEICKSRPNCQNPRSEIKSNLS